MRNSIFFLVSFLLFASFFLLYVPSVDAAQRVRGYIKKNGTYVVPHFKSSPNTNKFDNFSTKGNVNPFKISPKKFR